MGAHGIYHDATPVMRTTYTGPLVRPSSGRSTVRREKDDVIDPGVLDDATAGYLPGSTWRNTISGKVWHCRSASVGAADWVDLTAAGSTPAGSGSEIQYRASSSALGAIAGSAWDGSTVTLPSVVISSVSGPKLTVRENGADVCVIDGAVTGQYLTRVAFGRTDKLYIREHGDGTCRIAMLASKSLLFSGSVLYYNAGATTGSYGVTRMVVLSNLIYFYGPYQCRYDNSHYSEALTTADGAYKVRVGGVGGLTDALTISASRDATVHGHLSLQDGNDLSVGSTNGTKVGTTSGSKLGFWGATPAARPSYIADAAEDLADVTAKLNTLLGQHRTIGLMAAA